MASQAVPWAAVAIASILACSTPGDRAPLASDRGAELFARHCAFCHGPEGRGDGEAAPYLWPPPRDFGRAAFRLVSTAEGVPTDEDLEGVLRRGMPGSAMPAFGWLGQGDRRALVAQVRALAVEGRADGLEREGASPAVALDAARRQLSPGPRLDPGAPAEPSPGTLARGAILYDRHCTACHGEDGRGNRPSDPWNERGELQWARDFTAGVLEGGASHDDLAWRIGAGIPGTTMKPTVFEEPADAAALIAYVQSLLPPGSEERLVQTPRQLRVRRVGGDAPEDPGDPRWGEALEMDLPLAPLFWREDSVLGLAVAALHDDERLWVRMRWRDATRDDRAAGASALGDGVALALSPASAEAPLFGMGSSRHPVEIWHWKPFGADDVSALLEQTPHGAPPGERGLLDAPVYAPAPSGGARAVLAEGFRSAPGFEAAALPIGAAVRWAAGEWRVVLWRRLAAPSPRHVALAPGSSARIAFAVWNGSARDHDAQKSVTVWHRLDLDP